MWRGANSYRESGLERLLDPGAPFLEIGQLAAFGLYDGEAPGAGVICGVGRGVGARGRDRLQ